MMIINNRRKPTQTAKHQQPSDLSKAFSTPKTYLDGTLKTLRSSSNVEWWLNVDYVESEGAIA